MKLLNGCSKTECNELFGITDAFFYVMKCKSGSEVMTSDYFILSNMIDGEICCVLSYFDEEKTKINIATYELNRNVQIEKEGKQYLVQCGSVSNVDVMNKDTAVNHNVYGEMFSSNGELKKRLVNSI